MNMRARNSTRERPLAVTVSSVLSLTGGKLLPVTVVALLLVVVCHSGC